MKIQIKFAILSLAATVCPPSASHAQGSLTPPGAPAPTMKSLAQIEPRTPISSAPFTITNGGSYYLTTNLTVGGGDAITIAANDVTLDLNGFTIASTAASASGTGILLSGGRANIAIYNGIIRGGVTNNGSGVFSGPGFDSGIYYASGIPVNVRVANISVSGCLTYGICLDLSASRSGMVVESCTVNNVGGQGIVGDTVTDSTAISCGADAIAANQASHCRGTSFGGQGVVAKSAQNCYGSTVSGFTGMNVTTAENCWGQSFSSATYGLLAAVAQNSEGSGTGTTIGLSASTANNCFGTSSGSGTGLSSSRTANNCWGSSATGTGLSAAVAQNCYGLSTSGGGLSADKLANNCYGSGGGTGISMSGNIAGSGIANNCFGVATIAGNGILARIVTGSYGQSPNGYGISAYIANSCDGSGTPLGVGATYKYNMP